MNSNDPSDKPAADDDSSERKAAADSLRRQIEMLKANRVPRSLNEFAERKAAEEGAKGDDKD